MPDDVVVVGVEDDGCGKETEEGNSSEEETSGKTARGERKPELA